MTFLSLFVIWFFGAIVTGIVLGSTRRVYDADDVLLAIFWPITLHVWAVIAAVSAGNASAKKPEEKKTP